MGKLEQDLVKLALCLSLTRHWLIGVFLGTFIPWPVSVLEETVILRNWVVLGSREESVLQETVEHGSPPPCERR